MATILIVDDDQDIATYVAFLMQEEGHRTVLAEDGAAALRLALEERPDLILLDVEMPRLDGLETCRRLKANPATRHIPVVLLTQRSTMADTEEGLEAQADDYIAKPIRPEFLKRKIQRRLASATSE